MCPASVARRRAARPPEPPAHPDRRARRERARSTSRPGKPVTARTSSRAARAATTFRSGGRRRRRGGSAGSTGSLDAAAPPVPLDAAARRAPRGAAVRPVPVDAADTGAPAAAERSARRRRSSDGGSKPDGARRADVHRHLHDDPRRPIARARAVTAPARKAGVTFASQSSAYTAVRRRVTPGNGAGSAFYNTVNSGSMPRGAAKLSAANLAKIKTWIDAGAIE